MNRHLKVLFISLFFSVLIMLMKWWAYLISDSVALKTDALESFINIVAIIMAIAAIYQAQKPADSNHPYGHGKIEYFSSAIEGGMLLFGGCFLIYESIQALQYHNPLQEMNKALGISALSGLLNGALGTWQLREAKKLKSDAILADAKHILADFYTSIGVIIGLIIANLTGYLFIDSFIALVVSLILLKNAYEIIKNSALVLSDIEDPQLINNIVDALNSPIKTNDIIDVHRLRSFRSGQKHFVDLHIVVPEFWNVRQAHDVAEAFCSTLNKNIDQDSEFHPHVEACLKKYCTQCEVKDCPIRAEPFQQRFHFTSENVISSHEDEE